MTTKVRNAILADPRVAELEPERNGTFGTRVDWWCYLKRGFIVKDDATHCIHEGTLREVEQVLKTRVVPCTCGDCVDKETRSAS